MHKSEVAGTSLSLELNPKNRWAEGQDPESDRQAKVDGVLELNQRGRRGKEKRYDL